MTTAGRLDPAELSASSRSPGLWPMEDRLRLVGTQFAAFTTMVLGVYQTNRADGIQDRLGWLCLGMVGVIVSGVGNGVWLLRGRRVIGLARMRVHPDPTPRERRIVPVDVAGSDRLVASIGQRHYHRADCAFVAGREVEDGSVADHLTAGREPCAICQPGAPA